MLPSTEQHAPESLEAFPPPRPPSRTRHRLLLALIAVLLLATGAGLALVGVLVTRPPEAITTPTPAPAQDTTVSPLPTETPTPAQIVPPYDKSAYTATTVGTLDKLGAAGKGQFIHFSARLFHFVKDEAGMTVGANVSGVGSESAVLQMIFPARTDLTRLNVGDTIEAWGYDAGVFSGTNAYGGTVQTVVVLAVYLTDQTTNYSTA